MANKKPVPLKDEAIDTLDELQDKLQTCNSSRVYPLRISKEHKFLVHNHLHLVCMANKKPVPLKDEAIDTLDELARQYARVAVNPRTQLAFKQNRLATNRQRRCGKVQG